MCRTEKPNARIVDQDSYRPQLRFHSGNEFPHFIGPRDIRGLPKGSFGQSAQGIRRRAQLVAVAAANGHPRSQLGELHCNGATDAAATPGDQRNLIRQGSAYIVPLIRFTYARHHNSSFVRATFFMQNSS
jgi:hypothetical protein